MGSMSGGDPEQLADLLLLADRRQALGKHSADARTQDVEPSLTATSLDGC